MRRWIVRLLILGGLVWLALRFLPRPQSESAGSADTAPVWPPFADPPAPAPVAQAPAVAPWAEPVDGTCPDGFPVKVKLSSGIAHAPGGAMYDRTTPDRCYMSAAAAEADGFRLAKR